MLDQVRALDVGAVRQLEADRRGTLACSSWRSIRTRAVRADSSAPSCAQHLALAIAELPERERQMLALYYEHELTLAEIGVVIGVGESRVSQIRTQAIARLRSRAARNTADRRPR